MKLLAAAALACTFILPCYAQPSASLKLVWSDEFNTPGSPDTTKWGYDLGAGNPSGWGNKELEYYTNNSKNIRVENGSLIIEAHKETVNGMPYTSSRILTKKKGDWLYGRIEIRAKLPKGRGTWPAIWMLPTKWIYGGWPSSGEIDIMEHVGYDQGVVHGTVHSEKYNHIKQTQKGGEILLTDNSDAFHIYTVEWTLDKIDFLVDNKVFYTVTKDANEDYKGWPFDQSFHLIMNIAVGGGWGGKQGIDETIWPQRMVVDYVRVYQ